MTRAVVVMTVVVTAVTVAPVVIRLAARLVGSAGLGPMLFPSTRGGASGAPPPPGDAAELLDTHCMA